MIARAPWAVWQSAAEKDELALDPRAISRFRAHAMLLETGAWPKDVFYEVRYRRMGTLPGRGCVRDLKCALIVHVPSSP